MQPLDVSRVTRDVLFLQLMGGSTDPSHPVLDVIEVRNCLCCVHLQLYLCDKIILYRTSRVNKWRWGSCLWGWVGCEGEGMLGEEGLVAEGVDCWDMGDAVGFVHGEAK